MKNNIVVIGDSAYEITAAYVKGALAMRKQVPWTCCPYTGAQRQQWEDGHCHESSGEHVRFGLDLMAQPKQGTTFRDDPQVPRTAYGVDKKWYSEALQSVSPVPAESGSHETPMNDRISQLIVQARDFAVKTVDPRCEGELDEALDRAFERALAQLIEMPAAYP